MEGDVALGSKLRGEREPEGKCLHREVSLSRNSEQVALWSQSAGLPPRCLATTRASRNRLQLGSSTPSGSIQGPCCHREACPPQGAHHQVPESSRIKTGGWWKRRILCASSYCGDMGTVQTKLECPELVRPAVRLRTAFLPKSCSA